MYKYCIFALNVLTRTRTYRLGICRENVVAMRTASYMAINLMYRHLAILVLIKNC